jgi:hypothetical protein
MAVMFSGERVQLFQKLAGILMKDDFSKTDNWNGS